MTATRRTGNGAAFAFLLGLSIAIGASGCSSGFSSALNGRRGGDAVVTPTPDRTEAEPDGANSTGSPPADSPRSETPTPTATGSASSDSADTGAVVAPADADGDPTTVTAAWIYDGDTFRAKTADGRSVDVRLIGINAPETDECFGDESTTMLIDLIGRKQVELTVIATDEYGRKLADVVIDGVDVNQTMVENGGALTLHSDRGERLVALSTAEAKAQELNAGMWGAGCMTQAPVAIETVNFDAEGRDDFNVNGEWIVVVNTGPDISLNGWGLRDESTRHRFEFPADLVLAAGERAIVYSGCETDPPAVGSPPPADHTLYWCDPWGPIWTNRGDSAYLTDADGATVDSFAWS